MFKKLFYLLIIMFTFSSCETKKEAVPQQTNEVTKFSVENKKVEVFTTAANTNLKLS